MSYSRLVVVALAGVCLCGAGLAARDSSTGLKPRRSVLPAVRGKAVYTGLFKRGR